MKEQSKKHQNAKYVDKKLKTKGQMSLVSSTKTSQTVHTVPIPRTLSKLLWPLHYQTLQAASTVHNLSSKTDTWNIRYIASLMHFRHLDTYITRLVYYIEHTYENWIKFIFSHRKSEQFQEQNTNSWVIFCVVQTLFTHCMQVILCMTHKLSKLTHGSHLWFSIDKTNCTLGELRKYV